MTWTYTSVSYFGEQGRVRKKKGKRIGVKIQ